MVATTSTKKKKYGDSIEEFNQEEVQDLGQNLMYSLISELPMNKQDLEKSSKMSGDMSFKNK